MGNIRMMRILSRQDLIAPQIETVSQIDTLIQAGKKHISVLMGCGWGKTTLALMYACEYTEKKNVIYIAYGIALKENALQLFADAGIQVRSESIHSFTKAIMTEEYIPTDNDLWIIDEAQDSQICELQKQLNKCECSVTTLSFCDPYQATSGESDELINTLQSGDWSGSTGIVLATDRAIDARLSLIEEPENCQSIRETITIALKRTKEEIETCVSECNRLQDQQKLFSEQINQLQTDHLSLLEEKRLLDIKLEEAAKQIEALKLRCKMQDAILIYLGISEEDIAEAIRQIEDMRVSLQDQFDVPDYEMAEKAYQQLQDKVAEIAISIAERKMPTINAAAIADQLTDLFTPVIWNRLNDDSKRFLVSAEYTFETMSHQNERDELDYSGVCLLVTKAVELEVYRRFFNEYKEFIRHVYGEDILNWPQSMTTMDRFGIKHAASDFSLGKTVHIVGCTNGGQIDTSFMLYAKKDLYDGKDEKWIDAKLRSACQFIETVRNDYRNPAAHTAVIKYISAKECLEYVIEIHKKLKEMLVNMNH